MLTLRAGHLCLSWKSRFIFTAAFLTYLLRNDLYFVLMIFALVLRPQLLERVKGEVTFDELFELSCQSLFVVFCDTKISCALLFFVIQFKAMHVLIIPSIPIFLAKEEMAMFCLYDLDHFFSSLNWLLSKWGVFTILWLWSLRRNTLFFLLLIPLIPLWIFLFFFFFFFLFYQLWKALLWWNKLLTLFDPVYRPSLAFILLSLVCFKFLCVNTYFWGQL